MSIKNNITVSIRRAEGIKCSRCWKILSPEVMYKVPEDKTGDTFLCPRCKRVIDEMIEEGTFSYDMDE